MIVRADKGILHILDGNSGFAVISDRELDVEDAAVGAYLANLIDKTYDSAGLKTGEFKKSSGFKYQINEYLSGAIDFQKLSAFAADNIYDSISHADKIESADLIVCDCTIDERRVLAVLKCDNKNGFIHHVVQSDGVVKNEILNHYAILPPAGQRAAECAFIHLDDFTIKFACKRRKIEGETVDMMADVLLECDFDISTRESFSKMEKLTKKLSEDYGRDNIESQVKIKQYLTDNISKGAEEFEPEDLADAVFDGAPTMKDEFVSQIKDAGVPESIEMSEFVMKRAGANIKLKTDTGIEISFPAEYYKDNEHIEIINNDDGTLSLRINNIGELIG